MIRVDAGSVTLTATAIGRLGSLESEAILVAMGEVLRDEIKANLSLTDHSLAALAALDHPYARRHGSIRTDLLDHDGYLVHRQSGELLSALKAELLEPGDRFGVYLDPAIAEHATYVIEGTSSMLPRDTLWTTAGDSEVQRKMMRAAVRVLGKQLRTQAAIRFQRR